MDQASLPQDTQRELRAMSGTLGRSLDSRQRRRHAVAHLPVVIADAAEEAGGETRATIGRLRNGVRVSVTTVASPSRRKRYDHRAPLEATSKVNSLGRSAVTTADRDPGDRAAPVEPEESGPGDRPAATQPSSAAVLRAEPPHRRQIADEVVHPLGRRADALRDLVGIIVIIEAAHSRTVVPTRSFGPGHLQGRAAHASFASGRSATEASSAPPTRQNTNRQSTTTMPVASSIATAHAAACSS
jgi:hypothetical protein